MSTKVIFLDIDGVLNDNHSKSVCTSIEDRKEITGIDSSKVKRLSKIVAGTGAILVLTSSWKIGWERFKKENEWSHARYMDNKLKKHGLRIYDCTKERNLADRGTGIKAWLAANFAPTEQVDWIVLDDETFGDYDLYRVYDHLIKTDPEVGLTDEDVEKAIKMLKGDNDGC